MVSVMRKDHQTIEQVIAVVALAGHVQREIDFGGRQRAKRRGIHRRLRLAVIIGRRCALRRLLRVGVIIDEQTTTNFDRDDALVARDDASRRSSKKRDSCIVQK